MNKLLIMALLVVLPAGGSTQAVNPQNTFPTAVNVNNPSLWLNFNDATASFKDSVSGQSFTEVPQVVSEGTNCSYGTGTTTTLSCSLAATAGDAIVIYVDQPNNLVTTVTGVTDSLGGTATPVAAASSSISELWVIGNAVAGTHTITVTLATATGGYPQLQVLDVVGAARVGNPVDVGAVNTVTPPTTALTSGPIATTVANEMLLGHAVEENGGSAWTSGSPAFTLVTGHYSGSQVSGYLRSTGTGTYTFNVTNSASSAYTASIIAIKPNTPGTITPRQPGFDNTNNANYSAQIPYNGWIAAPNLTLGSGMEWDTPWTVMLHINKLNWDHTGTLMLASKGDLNGAAVNNIWWQLYIQKNAGNADASQLCFSRQSPAPDTQLGGGAQFVAGGAWCTATIADAMPNTFNYNIIVEDTGSGGGGAISIWINGVAQSITEYNQTAQGFGGVTMAVTAGGAGYTSSPTISASGGGTYCTATATPTLSSGVLTAVTYVASHGCTSPPTIAITGGGGSGAAITATTYPMTMDSPIQPLIMGGSVSNGVLYGPGGTDTSENPLYIDEFAIFPGNLSFSQITNIFYETKFYQNLVYPGLTSNPPLVILNGYGCGPDPSGDQTTAMVIGAHKAGLIRLIGVNDDDGEPNGSNSAGWWRQMLDQAGLADVPVSIGANSPYPNLGGCPAANITAYNANTPQNPALYESALTMYRTLFAEYPTTPIYVLMTQTANGYNSFQLSPADGISSLTGLQLQAQNYANGGWVSAFEGNFATSPSYYLSLLNNMGSNPIYFEGGNPANGGPGVLASRTSLDPMYQAAVANTTDTTTGWTNQNLAQVLTPYFLGGVQITASGGTGYAAVTGFTSVGGGPYCKVSGLMTSSGGVPSSFQTSWGVTPGATYDGLGYGCTPAVFTATGSGTNLTVSAVTLGTITIGDTISGTGIPTGTTIVSQTSGTTGGPGAYVTSVATNAAAATVTRTPTIVLTAPSGTGTILTVSNGIFLKTYEGSATASYAVWPNRWGESQVFTWFQNSLIDPPTTGAPRSY